MVNMVKCNIRVKDKSAAHFYLLKKIISVPSVSRAQRVVRSIRSFQDHYQATLFRDRI